jgi:23S rRNA (cytidine1920-2'-O)/16S rRNA (cytidine1409-2'-O)-methyltransferase
VIVMEQTNFRYSQPKDFLEGLPDFATIDVSFISLDLILPPLFDILVENGEVMALIKPQFEAGKEFVGKKGIVRDKKVHQTVVENTLKMAERTGFSILGLDFSPITGGQGNIEFIAHLKKGGVSNEIDIAKIIEQAHTTLD